MIICWFDFFVKVFEYAYQKGYHNSILSPLLKAACHITTRKIQFDILLIIFITKVSMNLSSLKTVGVRTFGYFLINKTSVV